MPASVSEAPTLARPVGFWPAVALVAGHTIGVGIFLTPVQVIGGLASPALTLGIWAACGGIVLAGALTFGELASRYPLAGGPYVYLREGWGRPAAFLYGWQSLLIMDPGVLAALASGLAEYAVVCWPAIAGFERAAAIAVIWLVAVVSMVGLRLGSGVLAGLTAFKFLALLAVVGLLMASGPGSWSHFVPFATRAPGAPPLGPALAGAFVGVFFSFGGFWEASRMAGEVRDAPRVVPGALVLGVGTVTAMYLAVTIAFMYGVPVQQSTSAAAFAEQAGTVLGASGPALLAGVVVLSVVVSMLALVIMAPRVYVAMSADGIFPADWAALTAAQSPVRATALLASLATLFVVVGTFQQIVAFFMGTTLVFVALAAAALVVIRRRAPEAAPFAAPGYPYGTVVFVCLLAGVVVLLAFTQPVQVLSSLALVLLGIVVWRRFEHRSLS